MATIKFQDLPNTNLLASLPLSSLNLIYTSLLQETVQKNDHSNKTGIGTRGPITRFHSKSPPPLGIQDYLNRLTKFTPFPRDSLILSSIYLNRISHLSISTAYSYSSSGSLDTFRDDPIPPNDPNRKPTTLFPNFIPNKPEPVVLFSPLVLQPTTTTNLSVGTCSGEGKTSRSFSNSSLPNFDLSCSSSPPSPTAISPSLPPQPLPPIPSSSSSSPSSSSKLNRPAPLLNVFTLHRLILSTLLISTKFLADGTLSQSRVSKVGGVSTTELARLEIESLRLLGWSLFVEKEEMEKVSQGWVQRGKELGLIPLNETEEELVNRDSEKEKEEKESFSPKSPPLLIVKASAASEFSNSNRDQSLAIPNIIPIHETVSSSSSSSSSSLSTSPSSTTTETTSTTISSSSNACSSPTAPDPTTIPDVLDEGGGGSPKNETTPKGGGISRELGGCKVESSDSNSNVDEAEGEVVGEGENTPTKAMKRIDLTTMNEQQEEEEEERISKEVEIVA